MVFNLKQYNALHLHEKAMLLENGAVFIDYHNTCDIIFTLFAYNGYFIEVSVTEVSHDLLNITAFKKGRKLDKYLNEISLDELL